MNEYIRSYDSLEDALADITRNTNIANAGLAPEQRACTWGTYWVRFIPTGQEMLVVFGRVQQLEETVEQEMVLENEMPGPDEAEVRATMQASHDQGYMFGRAYSVVEPRGELGSTHRANMWPITEDLYHAAQAANWDPLSLQPRDLDQLQDVYTAVRNHWIARSRG